MIRRSLAATLALSFGVTLLAVFVLVGCYLYVALDRQVMTELDSDVVLASRHVRRLASELDTKDDVKSHTPRLMSAVLGDRALSLVLFDPKGDRLLSYGPNQVVDDLDSATGKSLRLDPATIPLQQARVSDNAKIASSDVVAWTTDQKIPVRSVAFDVRLRDGTRLNGIVVRDVRAPLRLLDKYRDQLTMAGIVGSLVTMLATYLLIQFALRPLRQMTADATDITATRLDTRLQVVQSPTELGALAMSLNRMLARLEEGFQRLFQFTADLAHDMRTPIGNIKGATEVALRRPRSVDEYENLLASNLEECDRLSRMIENVLFLARAEHPQFITHMQVFNVADELGNIAGYFEGLADEAGSAIHVSGRADTMLKADLELFRRAVGNLLANAIRHTHVGTIEISAELKAGRVDVSVSNPGVAIDDEDIERIFDRFYRGDKSRRQSSGVGTSGASAGLGLAIVQTIMGLHDGRVAVTSRDGRTTFCLSWPQR
ncbi:heavy metal sensor histidine kinase [Pandoraea cepalis]|uniref:Sensor protein n=1 Tax=Pandoraea cepalis TaxID=2508294 RepID=A0A5E4YCS2_9BURK|nr:heavy metal sensor histidine kinase [Pandoraea cepalis]VVE46529.1 Sensor kinase CusS [Pandoraea cepalis]